MDWVWAWKYARELLPVAIAFGVHLGITGLMVYGATECVIAFARRRFRCLESDLEDLACDLGALCDRLDGSPSPATLPMPQSQVPVESPRDEWGIDDAV